MHFDKLKYDTYLHLNYYHIPDPILRIIYSEKDFINIILPAFKSPQRSMYKDQHQLEHIHHLYFSFMFFSLEYLFELSPSLLQELNYQTVDYYSTLLPFYKVLWLGTTYPFLLLDDTVLCRLVVDYLSTFRPLLHNKFLTGGDTHELSST